MTPRMKPEFWQKRQEVIDGLGLVAIFLAAITFLWAVGDWQWWWPGILCLLISSLAFLLNWRNQREKPLP